MGFNSGFKGLTRCTVTWTSNTSRHLIYSMEQSPSWEAKRFSASQ